MGVGPSPLSSGNVAERRPGLGEKLENRNNISSPLCHCLSAKSARVINAHIKTAFPPPSRTVDLMGEKGWGRGRPKGLFGSQSDDRLLGPPEEETDSFSPSAEVPPPGKGGQLLVGMTVGLGGEGQ